VGREGPQLASRRKQSAPPTRRRRSRGNRARKSETTSASGRAAPASRERRSARSSGRSVGTGPHADMVGAVVVRVGVAVAVAVRGGGEDFSFSAWIFFSLFRALFGGSVGGVGARLGGMWIGRVRLCGFAFLSSHFAQMVLDLRPGWARPRQARTWPAQ